MNIPVVGGEREDNICAFWQGDMGDQGPRSRFDWLEEWQDVVLSGPTYDVVHRGVETEMFL